MDGATAKPFDWAETTVEIAAPEEVHVKTVVLAQDGDFADAPRGRQVTSIEAALTVLDRTGRLRLKRGETVAFPAHLGGERILIDAWGPEDAPKPILDATRADGLVLREFRGEFALRGVDIVGGCDPVTETGISKGSGITIAGSGHFTLYDVEIRNVWTGIYPRMGDRADPWSLGVANSAIRNWTDYGFLCPRAYHVGWEGVVLSQHVDARGGGMGKVDGKFYNRHGCARYPSPASRASSPTTTSKASPATAGRAPGTGRAISRYPLGLGRHARHEAQHRPPDRRGRGPRHAAQA